jgi:phosphoesterase RecJ-like protein
VTKRATADLDAVCRAMRQESRVALTVHENPDYDALGAAVGLLDLFAQLGVAGRVYVDRGERLPDAEHIVPAGAVVRGLPPEDASLYALDCGSFDRIALPLVSWPGRVVDIDHHPDNTAFGELNLLRPEAASTSEIVCQIARRLDLRPSPLAAAALYTGISFDTGHFRHANTTAATLRCAARLVAGGAAPDELYRELYERRTFAGLRLWGRAVAGARRVADGRAVVSVLTRLDYEATGAAEDETEGIVDSLRALDGVDAAALVKEQTHGARVRVSLRSQTLDVGRIAAARGGGGHRNAAGFSSDDAPEEVARWLSSELARRLATASS